MPTWHAMTDADLADLADRARRRVVHLYAAVATLIALVSIAALRQAVASPRTRAAVAFWLFGCAVVLSLGWWWVGSRRRQAERLAAVVGAGTAKVKRVECTRLTFFGLVPFGWEVEVELEGEEDLLAVGFWSEADASRLVKRLAP